MAYSENTDLDREELRRRAVGVVIAVALEVLLLLALLSLTLESSKPKQAGRGVTSFNLEAESQSASTDRSRTNNAAKAVKKQKRDIVPFVPKPLLPPFNKVEMPPPNPDFIKVSKSEYDAMDISKLPPNGNAGTGDVVGTGQGNKGPVGPGAGPGGAPLYPVAWYREPTDPEMSPYLAKAKRAPPGAWAEIACVMIENYRVENCQILGESPRGTGLAQAIRRASWQFLVRPPRIGDKPQLDVWVRIRFTFRAADEQAPQASE